MKAMILIGGLGTRLRPLTCDTPKPLLPIVNRPFIDYQIDHIKKHGVDEIILCLSYMPEKFKNYVGNGKRHGVKISYVLENEPLGTGGAIRNAEKYVQGPVFIFNGDILSDVDLNDMYRFHKRRKAQVTIALTKVKDPTAYGLIETETTGKIKRFIEKPSWDKVTCNTINSGVYIFEKSVIESIPQKVNYSVERGLFPMLLADKMPFYGYTAKGYWIDIGTTEKYLQAHYDVLKGLYKSPIHSGLIDYKKDKTSVTGKDVVVGNKTQFNGYVTVGHNVKIGNECKITDSIILDGTRIEDGVSITSSIIGKDCVVSSNTVISEGTALGSGTIISKYSKV